MTGTLAALAPFVMVVAIVAIVSGGRTWRAYLLAKANSGRSREDEVMFGSMQAQIDRLTERVAVLEKLVTDDDRNLAREIDRLRDRPSP